LSSTVENSAKNLKVSIWRGTPDGGAYTDYAVPRKKSQTILDVVSFVQRYLEPGLSFRFACRVGMCGSCAMMVNGKPRWTCRTHVEKAVDGDKLVIAPLRNLPIIKDLACNMDVFFDKWTRAEARFYPTKNRGDDIEPVLPNSPARVHASQGIECINCAVCYAACDVVEKDGAFFGPAALNRAWTLVNDKRDGAGVKRLRAVSGEGGCQSCHSQQGCSEYCPNELNPTLSIAGLKRMAVKAAIKGEL